PDLLLRAAVKAASHAGVEVRSHVAVKKISARDGNIEVSAEAESLVARMAVNCQGAWAGAPVLPRKGQMCYLQPHQPELPGVGSLRPELLNLVVRAPEAYLVPRSSGKILVRSEEHTSELQSPCNIVCRLLLVKKKINILI